MKATEILKHEHQAILLAVAAAEREAAYIAETGKIHLQTVREMADFFRNFVDRCHHAKEEKHLFAVMHERGIPFENGPLGVMLHEHEQGRECVRALANAVAPREPDEAAVRKAGENLSTYAQLLREHINKEDHVLYPMADQLLTANDQEGLNKAFDRVESDELGDGVHEKYHAWLKKLADE